LLNQRCHRGTYGSTLQPAGHIKDLCLSGQGLETVMAKYPPVPPGKKLIFRRWKVDPKTGRRIYPKRGVFPMIVDDDEQQSTVDDNDKKA
jgi:hypothetical protein